jgi:hypothetical protein
VGEWRFEWGNSSWTYDEEQRNNGTVTGATHTQEGRVGWGYEFDGSGSGTAEDVINIAQPAIMNVTDNWTMAAWFFPRALPSINAYVLNNGASGSSGFNLKIENGNWTWIFGGVTGASTNRTADLNEWQHIILTRRNGNLYLYKDGIDTEGVLSVSSPNPQDSGSTTSIGALYGSRIRCFNGTIDEVILWNRSLTGAEIYELYNTSKGRYAIDDEDLGCSLNDSYDADAASIKGIINWYRNNQSIAVLNLPFENNGSDAGTSDYSGYGNDGIEGGDVAWNSSGGHDGKGAYEFDGTGDHINISDDSSLEFGSKPYSVSLWIKPGTVSGVHYIIGKGRVAGNYVWELYQNGNGINWYPGPGPEPAIAGQLAVGRWSHLVGVRNGSTGYLYVNGWLGSSGACGGSTGNTAYPTTISCETSNVSLLCFDGTIDDVLIFNRTLTSTQVQTLYRAGFANIDDGTTQAGEGWHCSVTPNDGVADGTSYNSSYVVINATTYPYFTNAVNYSADYKIGSTFDANITINHGKELAYYTFHTNNSGSWAEVRREINGTSYDASETNTIVLAVDDVI